MAGINRKPFSEACERNREPILSVLKRVFKDRRSVLEIGSKPWPAVDADAAFSANTAHIMSWVQVERMFQGVARLLPQAGRFALYGPFHYGGQPTSPSNARFDAMLRTRDSSSGIRDFEHIQTLAGRYGLALLEDNAMPANNRLLVFRKEN